MSGYAAAGLLLGLLALAFVLYPILRPAPARKLAAAESAELAERRRAIYRQILEVEFDQRVGKLDEADARELGEALLREAAELLAAQQTEERAVGEEVEREIEALRRALTASNEPERERGAVKP